MLRLIATFIIIYLAFRVFTALFFPLIAKWYLNRFKKRFYQQNPGYEERSRKGKVNIKMPPGAAKAAQSEHIGEYVDYEEIKEDPKKP